MTQCQKDSSAPELVIVSAGDDEALVREMNRMAAFIGRLSDVSVLDLAYTASLSKGPAKVAVIAASASELAMRLGSAASRISQGAVRIRDKSGTYYSREKLLGPGAGKLAFIYPGVMSYYPDMMRDLAVLYPECRSAFDELEEALAGVEDFIPSNFIFPPAPYYRHDADIFSAGAYAQALVSVYAASTAMTRLLEKIGVSPDGVVGSAGGDLAAVMCSGAAGSPLPRHERVRAVSEIYKTVDKAIDHAGLPKAAVVSVLLRHPGEADAVVSSFDRNEVRLAMDFSPRQRTYVVSVDAEEKVLAAFAEAGIRTVKSTLDRPFNTPLSEKIVPAIKKFAGAWIKSEPVCDVYSCAVAARLAAKPRVQRNDTAERWAKSVRFTETVRSMYADGYRVFLEVGPRGLMTSAVEDILEGGKFAAIASNSIHRKGRLQAVHAVAQLASLGADVSLSSVLADRGAKKLDFDAAVSMEVRKSSEMRLSRLFPQMTLTGSDQPFSREIMQSETPVPGAGKAAARAAALAEQRRRNRQFGFGAAYPLVSDADEVSSSPGISCELVKTFTLGAAPFIGDFSYGASQLSYSDPNLRGLVMLSVPLAVEIMAETALRVMPGRRLVAVEDFVARRQVKFTDSRLRLSIRAERTAAPAGKGAAVKVQLRADTPNAEYTWPVMEADFILSEDGPVASASTVEPLSRPRSIHWSGRDIYPSKLGLGKRLRGIVFAETWGEGGLDYEVETPPLAGNVAFTRFPMWVVNPLLLEIVVSGFLLWRRHEKFPGAFSYPCRFRRIEFKTPPSKEGSRLKCYLRLSGVTPSSHICNITVTSGDGNEVMEIGGWEEITERVPQSYCEMVLQPATSFITESLPAEALGDPATDVSSAFVTDVPYALFEKNEEFWLKIISHIVLNSPERKEFAEMGGSVRRRTEWLFGRIAAKEAVRRFLRDFYQARWSYADVQIWPDPQGKPVAIGDWSRFLASRIDIAIAHTSQFVIAVAAANARVGVDVEAVSRDLSEEFTRGVFTADELELAAASPNASQAVLRFWCAKEAISKALGTGIRYSPRELVVSGYQADTGAVTMRLSGAWENAFKDLKGRDMSVATRVMREHALAFSFIPESLFSDGGVS